jgi:uncharacterized membrane protein YkvA (DUF1232 family)
VGILLREKTTSVKEARMGDQGGIIVLVLVLTIIYVLFPADVIPDAIPVVGWADDAVVVIGAGAIAASS